MKKRSNPKIEAMKERSLIVENERKNLHTPKFYINEQEEEINTTHDRTYDYKKDGDKYFFRKKGEENWKQTDNSAVKSVFGDGEQKSVTKSGGDTKYSVKVPFKNTEEGNAFRQWVNNTHPDYAKEINLDKEGSYNNSYVAKAWNKYGKDYKDQQDYLTNIKKGGVQYDMTMQRDSLEPYEREMKNKSDLETPIKGTPNKKDVITGNYLIPVAWPEYEPKAPSDWNNTFTKLANKAGELFVSGSGDSLGKLGHGGVGIVEKNGNVTLFEFGRYSGSKKGMGLTKIANIGKVAKLDSKGKLLNANEVAKLIKQKSQGDGKKHKMNGYVVPLPDVTSALSFAKREGQKSYDIIDMDANDDDYNCGTFGISVAKAGGIPLADYCFPTPISALNSFESHSVGSVSA